MYGVVKYTEDGQMQVDRYVREGSRKKVVKEEKWGLWNTYNIKEMENKLEGKPLCADCDQCLYVASQRFFDVLNPQLSIQDREDKLKVLHKDLTHASRIKSLFSNTEGHLKSGISAHKNCPFRDNWYYDNANKCWIYSRKGATPLPKGVIPPPPPK